MTEPAFNPWLGIWIAPRQTIRRIVALNPRHSVHALAALGGIASVLYQMTTYRAGEAAFTTGSIILAGIALGPVYGIVELYVVAALLAWVGRPLGGRASPGLIRCALAWSKVPSIFALPLLFAGLLLARDALFGGPAVVEDGGLALVLALFMLAMLGIGIASLIIHLQTLGEVQGFSAWVALANFAVVFLLLILPLSLLLQLGDWSGLVSSPADP